MRNLTIKKKELGIVQLSERFGLMLGRIKIAAYGMNMLHRVRAELLLLFSGF